MLSGYGAFVVVILFHTCQYQCYIDTYTEYRYQPFLQQICELPEENNAVQLAPVWSTTALSVGPTVSPAVEFK